MPVAPLRRVLAGYLAAAGGAVAMSAMVVFVKQVTVPAETVTLVRLGAGACLFLVGVLVTGRWRQLGVRPSGWLLISAVVTPLIVLAYVQTLRQTSAANAAFVLYLGPVFAAILARLVFGEELSRRTLALLVLALAGTGLLVGGDPSASDAAPTWLVWGLGSAIAYASYILANRKIPAQIPAEARTLWQLGLGALITLVLLAPDLLVQRGLDIPAAEIPWLVAIGLVNGAFAVAVITWSLKVLRAGEYAVIAYIEPVSAALLGFLFLSETPGPAQLLGGAMVVAAGVLQASGAKPGSR
jgi:drug/metabolite transporter (DMT)-like permease